MSIPEETIDRIRERLSFTELASEYVTLKRSGKTFTGLCPFHSEKTPSFHINEEEGLFHCFGCGKKGSIFSFLMEMRGYTFPEAVKLLAARAGITIEESIGGQDDKKKERQKLLRGLSLAAQEVYHRFFLEDSRAAAARHYLQARGIEESTTRHFKIGYAPESWDFLPERILRFWKEQQRSALCDSATLARELLHLGLLRVKGGAEEGGAEGRKPYDTFRNRLIFPITRSDGAPIAFGARIISADDNAPKYLNSCESELYSKRRAIYGMPQAIEAIRKSRELYLVEGYMDVLSMYQHGRRNAVAGCGTAITTEHAQTLKRLADRVYLLFDGDSAGRKAAGRAFEAFLNSGLDPIVVLLPEGEDPDSLARKGGDQLEQCLRENQRSGVSVYLDWLLTECAAGATQADAASIGRAAERFAQSIAQIINPVERELRVQQGATQLGVSADAILKLMRHAGSRSRAGSAAVPSSAGRPAARTSAPEIGPGASARFTQPASTPSGLPSRERPASNARPAVRRAPAPVTPEMPTKAEDLDPFDRQLVVAVLCQPGLALNLMEMPSVAPTGRFSGAVQSFLEELIELEQQGRRDWDLGAPTEEQRSAANAQALLERHGLHRFRLLEEAIRQLRVGGSRHSDLIREVGTVSARRALKVELLKIRQAESGESDVARLEQLAQEKLLKKRNLERLKGERG